MNFSLKTISLLDACSHLEHKPQGRGQTRTHHPGATSLLDDSAPTSSAGRPAGGQVLTARAVVSWGVSGPLAGAAQMRQHCLPRDWHPGLVGGEVPPGQVLMQEHSSVSAACAV